MSLLPEVANVMKSNMNGSLGTDKILTSLFNPLLPPSDFIKLKSDQWTSVAL